MDNYFTPCVAPLTSDLRGAQTLQHLCFQRCDQNTHTSRQPRVRRGNAMYIVALFHNKSRKVSLGLLLFMRTPAALVRPTLIG